MSVEKPGAEASDRIWYFAYGSCLNPSVLGAEARVPLRVIDADTPAQVCTLKHFQLIFNAWSPIPLEPAFANICAAPGESVLGVAYHVTREQFRRIARSEGAATVPGQPALSKTIDVVLQARGSGKTIRAKTFVFPSLSVAEPRRPSARYARLVFDGMMHWNFDDVYIRKTKVSEWITADTMSNLPAQTKSVLRAFAPNVALPEHLVELVRDEFWLGSTAKVIDPCVHRNVDVNDCEERKPWLFFIPGIDGSSLTLLPHIEALSLKYRLRCLVVPPATRYSWLQLENIVAEAIGNVVRENERAIVFGESMGAVLSLSLASKHPKLIDSAFVLNPATSFNRAPAKAVWHNVLPNLPDSAYSAAPYGLVPALYDLELLSSQLASSDSAVSAFKAFSSIGVLRDLLPRRTLQHRLNLLHNMPVTDRTLARIQVPVVILASPNDALIPSAKEAERLIQLIPMSRKVSLPSGGHASLADNRLDIPHYIGLAASLCTAMNDKCMASSQHFGKVSVARGRDIIRAHFKSGGARFEPPTKSDIAKQLSEMASLRRLFSPVFVGMDNIPAKIFEQDRPVLFIANHTMYGFLDVAFVVAHVLEHRGVLLRGLTHPAVFAAQRARRNNDVAQETPQMSEARSEERRSSMVETMEKFGSVKVNPRNTFRLLRANEAVLLLPGGVREAYKRRGERHTLHWPEDPEFVRMALRFNALVVPVACVGQDDCFQILADGEDILNTPVLGALVKERVEKEAIGTVRGWKGSDGVSTKEARDFVPPFSLPSKARRLYFGFGKPIDLADMTKTILNADTTRTLDVAEALYRAVEAALENEIKELDMMREKDQYDQAAVRRLLYEARTGAQAPTAWSVSGREGYYKIA